MKKAILIIGMLVILSGCARNGGPYPGENKIIPPPPVTYDDK